MFVCLFVCLQERSVGFIPRRAEVKSYVEGLDACIKEQGEGCRGFCLKTKRRLKCLPKFILPNAAAATLQGGLHYYRLTACTGCLAKYLNPKP